MDKQMKDKRSYEEPQLTVVTFEAERGYSASDNTEVSISGVNLGTVYEESDGNAGDGWL